MNGRTCISILALLAITITGATATVVQVEIPAVDETHHAIDLGVQIEEVISLRLLFAGVAQDHYYECQNVYPGGPVDYEHWESTHVWFQIDSHDGYADSDWYSPNGPFDEDLTLTPWGSDNFLSDGTGTLFFEMWVELFPPESEDCGLSEPGFVDFQTPLTLIVEYTPAVPNESATWSAVKTLYR